MRAWVLVGLLALLAAGYPLRQYIIAWLTPAMHTVRVWQYGGEARGRLRPAFQQAGVRYPPARVLLLALKQERELHLYAADIQGEYRYVKTYPILGASGEMGPKLHEGDLQVPEGEYRIESLHPMSLYHLALRVNYPNAFDRDKARHDGRSELGGDIMIHGSDVSLGCLAMGNRGIRELYLLAHDTSLEHCRLLISPCDFRRSELTVPARPSPAWLPELYENIQRILFTLPPIRD